MSAQRKKGSVAAKPRRKGQLARGAAGAKAGCPIVGVGASAGGLEAFTQLLKHLPADTGFGFVLVQHLDPLHESALTQLLARATAMPVLEVTNRMRVAANHVYVIPPNTNLGISSGVLQLLPRAQNRTALRSIDLFFEALAQDQRERAIGVILSGTATDGTLGLEAIKAEGGLTFAQDDTARYDSMPRSAVAAGCVDFVLAPAAIARELTRIAKHPFVAASTLAGVTPRPASPTTTGRPEQKAYEKILLILRNHSGVDFSLYKTPTIHRRITRRMVLNQKQTLESYADSLRGKTKELDALYADTLINVTSFFRNPDAFEVLKHRVFPQLLQSGGDEPLRVWVLGCSTGQEAYSIAMVFAECAEKAPHPRKLQVFATDLNHANLDKARHGLYSKSVTSDVSPERLRRFFVEEEGGYRIIKSLRESIVFARQNLISDPPFSRMDLISCRNLLIYLETSLQKKLIPTFHYALKPEGVLFLGASESIGGFPELFAPVDKKQKIFSKKAAPTLAFHLPIKKPGSERPLPDKAPRPSPLPIPGQKPGGPTEAFRGELSAEREADRVTVNQFAPPAVLINADLQILQFRGPTGAYLEPPTGKASFDLLKMAREGLMLPLRATINQAKLENKTTRKENVPLVQNGRTRSVNIEVVPLKNLKERCFLVLFEDAVKPDRDEAPEPATSEPEAPSAAGNKQESSRVVGLEQDLAEARDYLHSVEEQQEAANEELQAANEEGQSANEELQSLNEELETSKEELESTNEELTTVNEEMGTRNLELNRLNSDLTNFQTSTKLVIVLLGRDLTIRRFSVQAEKQFNLHAADLGQPIGNVRHNLDLRDLDTFITEVITSVRENEREVRDRDGRWYSLRVRPYLTIENKVDGAVLVLMDINASKEAAQEVSHTRDFAEAIIGSVRDPLLILDAELRVKKANESFFTTFKVSPAKTIGHSVFKLGDGNWNIPRLRKLLLEILPRQSTFNDFEVTHDFERLGRRTMLLNARMLHQGPGQREKIILGFQDITDRKRAEETLRQSEERYRVLFTTIDEGFCVIEMIFNKRNQPVDYRFLEVNPTFETQTGLRDATGKRMRELVPGIENHWFEVYGKVALTGKSIRFVNEVKAMGGRWFDVYACRVGGPDSRKVAIIFNDISARRRTEQALRDVHAQLATHAGQLEVGVARRTAQLIAKNRLLKASLASVGKGKEEIQTLLLESQEMQEKLRQLTHQILTAQEQERKKISRDLHDEVVQALVGINVELSALVHGSSTQARQMKGKIARIQRMVEKSVDSVHRFARDLRPSVLDDLGLIPALHAFCRELAARKKLKIKLTAFGGVEALESDKRTVFYRVAQEALNNIARHARASQVALTISRQPGALRLEIVDDGKAFSVKKILLAKNNKRLGLVGMKERIEMIGGTLTIESVRGRGTTVRADIPFVPRKKSK